MKPALAQVSTLHSSFDADLADYAAGHCPAIEVWLGKLDSYLETHDIRDVRQLLDEHRISAPVSSFQGGLLTSQGDARREHWNLFSQRLQQCQSLGIGTLVVAADIIGPITQQDLDRARLSLSEAAQRAETVGVRLALEFQTRSAFCNNLQTALAMIEEVGHAQLGICLDLFHFYTGPSKTEDLEFLSSDNLFHVQLCDLLGVPRELASDADRVLPGDGDFHLEPIIERLRQINYSGHVSIELLNPQIWRIPPREFGEIGMTALRKVLGIASMGNAG